MQVSYAVVTKSPLNSVMHNRRTIVNKRAIRKILRCFLMPHFSNSFIFHSHCCRFSTDLFVCIISSAAPFIHRPFFRSSLFLLPFLSFALLSVTLSIYFSVYWSRACTHHSTRFDPRMTFWGPLEPQLGPQVCTFGVRSASSFNFPHPIYISARLYF